MVDSSEVTEIQRLANEKLKLVPSTLPQLFYFWGSNGGFVHIKAYGTYQGQQSLQTPVLSM